MFPARPGTLSPAAVSPILVFSFGWAWQVLVCPSLDVIFLFFDNLWSLAGQVASEWWSWELIARESFVLGQLELSDRAMPSRCEPVSFERFIFNGLLTTKLDPVLDLPH